MDDLDVYTHPDLPAVERRTVQLDRAEFRDEGDKLIFEGRAAVFGEWADIGGAFREQIKRGAFKRIDETHPVVLTLNHNLDLAMASTRVKEGPGSLNLAESPRGLEVYSELAPTSTSRDAHALVKAGVIDKMSFSWPRGATSDDWVDGRDGMPERSITEFRSLLDVCMTAQPAYTGTSASMRSQVCGIDLFDEQGDVQRDLLDALAKRIHRGSLTVSADERWHIDTAFAKIGSLSPWMEEHARRAFGIEPAALASTDAEENPDGATVAQWRLGARSRRLRLINLNAGS